MKHRPVNNIKNRERDAPTFANINLLGICNVRCFFCLGLDIRDLLCRHNQLNVCYHDWKNFEEFLDRCNAANIKKLYITGQNTDSLLYKYLNEIIIYLVTRGFDVGLRTNGYEAHKMLDVINKTTLSVGYSIHSLNPTCNNMIMGRSDLPDWERIIPATERPRVSIVLTRCNEYEFWDLVKYLKRFPNIRYIQVRRPSTDTRLDDLAPDMAAYERVYTSVNRIFPLKKRIWGDAEIYDIFGQEVCFWRTVKTSVNSFNYFTDGTISEEYFVVEGYLNNYEKPE